VTLEKTKMTRIIKVLLSVAILSVLGGGTSIAAEMANFEGWSWGIYAESKDDLPPSYRDMPLSEVPEYYLELDIKQKRKRISGHYLSTWQFASKIEEGEFSAEVKGNKAFLDLESGFEGKVRVRLLREDTRLQWKVIKRKGINCFHNEATLSNPTGASNKEDTPDRKAVR
jgi:hypothetical protein